MKILHSTHTAEPFCNWVPLNTVLTHKRAEEYMWMGGHKCEDGTFIHAYKHSTTRNYIYLDPFANPYEIKVGNCGKQFFELITNRELTDKLIANASAYDVEGAFLKNYAQKN